jgi:type IV fimbrial biogenesis protein FimT
MLIVITVIGIFMTVSVPSFSHLLKNVILGGVANDFAASISLAKSTAALEKNTVILCRGRGNACGNDVAWNEGWLLFVADGNGNPAKLLKRASGQDNDVSFRFVNFSSNTINTITVETDGNLSRSMFKAESNSKAHVVLCDSRGERHALAILINPVGHPLFARDSNNDGIVEGYDGRNIVC